ncbi:MAG: hypothetical protein K2H48_07045, partial [Duncaniella sp.]|nr:hypothetical protein [Duncaniella sp.]
QILHVQTGNTILLTLPPAHRKNPLTLKLFFLLVKPYIEAAIAFFKSIDVEVVYQNFGQYCSEQLGWFHCAKITLYSDIISGPPEKSADP